MPISLTINDKPHAVDVPPEMPLLWVLRNELGMMGTKFGCGMGVCGACTVHLDGNPRRACQTPVGKVGTAKITTIEGVGKIPQGVALQKAWQDIDVPQCGYCQAGQIMSATALLQKTPQPSPEQIGAAMFGNICRCASYPRIMQAIRNAAKDTDHAR